MLALVLEPLETKRGLIPAGQVIEITDALSIRLKGKVMPMNEEQTGEKLYRMIKTTLAEIDQCGSPWTNWRRSLTSEQMNSLVMLEQQIDSCYARLDVGGLTKALQAYQHFCLAQHQVAGGS